MEGQEPLASAQLQEKGLQTLCVCHWQCCWTLQIREKNRKEPGKNLQDLPGNKTGFPQIYLGTHYAPFIHSGGESESASLSISMQSKEICASQWGHCLLTISFIVVCHLPGSCGNVGCRGVVLSLCRALHQGLLINLRFIKPRKRDLQDQLA